MMTPKSAAMGRIMRDTHARGLLDSGLPSAVFFERRGIPIKYQLSIMERSLDFIRAGTRRVYHG